MIRGKRSVTTLMVTGAALLLVMFFSAFVGISSQKTIIKGVVLEKLEVPALDNWDPAAMMAGRGEEPGGGPIGTPGGAREGGPGVPPGGPGGRGGAQPTPAVYIDNGAYAAGKSKTGAVSKGEIKDSYASNVQIVAKEEGIGGVYVKGAKSQFTLTGANIELTGKVNGLGGPGSGAEPDDHGTLIIRNSKIVTNGESQSATAAENYSTLIVNNSTLIAHGIPFTPDITNTGQKKQLEVDGTARAHVTMSNSESYFNNSTIIADGWGALSTDASGGYVYVEANHCDIQTIKHGYGTYADHYCIVSLNNSKVTTAAHTAIVDKNGKVYLNNVDATAGKYCALIHNSGMPVSVVGTFKVRGGRIETTDAAILVKSTNADILLDGTKLASRKGILIKSQLSDDPGLPRPSEGQKVYGIHATFRDMDIAGDLVHTDKQRDMFVFLESTILKGAIKDAHISVDPASRWIATADSTATIIGNVDLAQIDAPKGVTISAIGSENGSYRLASGGTLNVKAR
jgi:hypothetical protein